jgi:hypothetical protein
MIELELCVCGHPERDHEAYEPPYTCSHGMTVDDPDSDCDCMDYDQAVALISAATVAELRAAREVVEAGRHFAGPVGEGWHDEECTPDYGPDEPEKCYEFCPTPRLNHALAAYDQVVGS